MANPPTDPALAGILAFGIVIRQDTEAAMAATAAERAEHMTDTELELLHATVVAIGRVTGSTLAYRRRV